MLRTSKLLGHVVSRFWHSCKAFQGLLEGPGAFRPRARAQRRSTTLRLEALEDRTLMDGGLGAGPALAGPAGHIVGNLYQVLLHRAPEPLAATAWEAALRNGLSPGAAAGRFLAGPEYQAGLVRQDYERLLGREPEPGMAAGWLALLQGGLAEEGFTAALLASGEFFAAHGSNASGWVTALYQDVLGRAPQAAEFGAWQAVVSLGATRPAVARAFLDSHEAHVVAVAAGYAELLGRAPDGPGGTSWTAALDGGLSRGQFQALLVGSPEFTQRLSADPATGSPIGSSPRLLSGGGVVPDAFVPADAGVDTPPIEDCDCGDGGSREMVRTAGGVDGFTSSPSSISGASIRYFDGAVKLSTSDLTSEGFGTGWGATRSWTNTHASNDFNGSGVIDSQLPYMVQDNINLIDAVVTNGLNTRYFDDDGAGHTTPHHFLQDSLAYNSAQGEYVFTDTLGDQIRFYDFSTSKPSAQRGRFKSLTDPDGNVTSVTSLTGGKAAEVQRSTTTGGVTTTESYLYTYIPTGSTNAGLISNVTLRRQTNGGAWSTVRQVDYAYYDGVEAHGNLGDLKTATVKDASGNVLDTKYYRYYTGEAGGYTHGLKYAFGPQSYARLAAAYPTPSSATDAQVAPYADDYYEYDTSQRVTKAVVQGAGCSSCTGGQGTFTYAYATSTNLAGYNSWAYKTTETLPDGNQNIVYANSSGEVMLKVYHDVTANQNWETFCKYDGQGRVILWAGPSALTGYDDTKADLLNSVGGNYQYMSDSSGLVTINDYYASTTATETTAGAATGYYQDTKVQQGELGTPILQSSAQYFAHTGGGATVYPVATQTAYRNTDGTGAETTSYSYTWFTGTTKVQSHAVSAPVVSAAQNGPGTADVITTYYDSYGRPIWTKDADGFLNYTAYDAATSAVVKTITDVDTTRTGDFQNLPSGWATPSGGGLHLITQMQVDGLGRTTKLTDPAGNVTYTVYNDTNYEALVYPGWNSSTNLPTGPTQVTREDRPGSYLETLTMSATPHLTGGVPDGTEAVSNLQTLSRSYTNSAGQLVRTDAYFSLSGVTYSTAQYIGTQNTNYYTALFSFDERGRPNRTQLPTGTINRTVYDGLGRVVSTWVGTNDTPASGYWSPTNNTAPSNMVQVTGNVFDGGGVGDSLLTQATQYPGGSAAARVTQFYFDWRDRLVATKSGVQTTEDTTTHRPILYFDRDNLNEVIATGLYDGDTVSITVSNGVPAKPAAGLLRAYQTADYDDQGRAYALHTFSVDQATGAVSAASLNVKAWYNHRGQTIKLSQPGGLVRKTSYDGAGRPATAYVTDGGGDSSWADAGNVVADNVLQQTETQYNADGNAVLVTVRQRFDNETATGALGNPTTAPLARVSYTASYFDAANRLTAKVNVGTNGGAAYTRPATPPAASDTVLVASYSYNAAGWVGSSTDPRGIVTQNSYDNLGRATQVIQAYTNGTPTSTSDKTTQFTYDGDNNPLTVTAVEPGGALEKTQYVYGVSTAAGSDVNSNDIAAAVQYPDPATGQPSSSQQETYTVNALGDRKKLTDRIGTVHTYSFDVLGRQTSDAITTLGAGVDGTVQRIDTAFDTGGRPYLYTSYASAAGGTIVNQVQQAYNGLGQLTAEYQSHSGAVNTGTTPSVQYAYSQMAGGANHSRPITLTYPNGRILNYNYNAGLDDSISRLSSISDSSATLEAYTYLGLGTVVKRSHPQPGVDLSYIKQMGEANGDAGDPYTGLDRFGRVVDQRWIVTSTGAATDRFQYGYDRDGNRLYRSNLVNHNFDELYHASGAGNGYDNFNQLTAFARGVLSASQQGGPLDTVASPSHSQSWSLDALGNWTSVTTDGTPQNRTHNQQNEVTGVGGNTLTFDANGSLTKDDAGQTYAYDGWNRLVQVKNSGGSTLATYSYDGLRRRITESSSGTARDLYFSAAWQVLEERVAGQAKIQYVWSPVYVDGLVERDRDPNGSGSLSERLYAQQDAGWNVTALINTSGSVVERYVYDPFGRVTFLSAAWGTLGASGWAWVYLHQGLRNDPATGLDNARQRDYSPSLGRWLRVDPVGFAAGDTNLYRFVGDNPQDRTDPSGLLECDCPPSQCKGLSSINNTLNAEINRLIQQALEAEDNQSSAEQALYDLVAEDVVSIVAFYIPVTEIEAWVDSQGKRYVGISAAPFPHYFYNATCIRVKCGTKDYCIGSDKIGHLFQQGHILYDLYLALQNKFQGLTNAQIMAILKQWNAYTEGVPLDFISWLAIAQLGPIPIYGYRKPMDPLDFFRQWGGYTIGICPYCIIAVISYPDMAANLGGLAFWQDFLGNPFEFKFDICNYINQDWLEPQPKKGIVK